MNDAELDALFKALPEPAPSAALEQQVLQNYARLVAPPPAPKNRHWWGMGLATASLTTLFFLLPDAPLSVGDPSKMLARGIGDETANLHLDAAVQIAGQEQRLSIGTAYPAGTTLIFRVSTDRSLPYTLSRNGQVFAQGNLASGETVLPTGYMLEAGEDAAHFVLQTPVGRAELQIPAVRP